MFKWLKKLIKSIYSPKEFSDSIHKKNRRAMKQGFWFSTAFGSVVLLASLILTKGHLTGLQIFYYSYYIVMGLIGLLLCHLKTGKYIPLIFGMVEFALIFIFYIHHKSFTEALVFFLGFIVAVEMLLNMNPIVFTISLVLYEILLLVLYVVKVIQFSDGLNMDVGINLFFLNCINLFWN